MILRPHNQKKLLVSHLHVETNRVNGHRLNKWNMLMDVTVK